MRSFFFIKVFLYLKNRVNELFIRNARFARLKLLLPKNGPSGLFGGSPLNCTRNPYGCCFADEFPGFLFPQFRYKTNSRRICRSLLRNETKSDKQH